MSLPFTSLDAATAVGPGESRDLEDVRRHFTVVYFATGGPTSASVVLEGSHDGTNWVQVAGMAAGPTPSATTIYTNWFRHIRANLTALNGGTSPTVTATIAVGDEEED